MSSSTSVQHILLTGLPGSGKTTLIKAICNELSLRNIPLRGFYTEELREKGQRIGFDIVSLEGSRAPLARTGDQKGPKVGKYVVDIQPFEDLALPLLCPWSFAGVTVVDEVGKMELFSSKFEQTVKGLFQSKNVLLGTIPLPKGKPLPLVENLRKNPSVKLVTVDVNNRDLLLQDIVDHLVHNVEVQK